MSRALLCCSFALRRLVLRQRGATSVEYALMASLIAVVIILAVATFGQRANALFHEVEIAAAMNP